MATLNTKVKLYLEANSKVYNNELDNFQLRDDGSGVYIDVWNVDGLAKPTDEQIASYETAATTEEANNVVIATRKTAYGSWETQLEEIYDDGVDSWKARIKSIKDANPKS